MAELKIEVECPDCATVSLRREVLVPVGNRILCRREPSVCPGCGRVLHPNEVPDMADR